MPVKAPVVPPKVRGKNGVQIASLATFTCPLCQRPDSLIIKLEAPKKRATVTCRYCRDVAPYPYTAPFLPRLEKKVDVFFRLVEAVGQQQQGVPGVAAAAAAAAAAGSVAVGATASAAAGATADRTASAVPSQAAVATAAATATAQPPPRRADELDDEVAGLMRSEDPEGEEDEEAADAADDAFVIDEGEYGF